MEKTESKKSFDFKLMMFYHISMMVLFPLGFVISPKTLFTIAFTELVILVGTSIIYKRKHNWRWVNVTLKDWAMAIFSIIAGWLLIYVTSEAFGDIDGPLTPWICAIIGIFIFNFLKSIKLAETTKEEFDFRCKSIQSINSSKDRQADKYKILKMSYKVIFFSAWLSGMYLFYSLTEYYDTYSKEPSPIKK